ncbi:MAG: hypothetical protein RIS64_2725 [Bacteroidota bacterium]
MRPLLQLAHFFANDFRTIFAFYCFDRQIAKQLFGKIFKIRNIMGKNIKHNDAERETKSWREAELIKKFNLTCITTHQTPLMQEWLDVTDPDLNAGELYIFDKIFKKAQKNLRGWNEEDLKIKFIGPILELGQLIDDEQFIAYFDKTISATVDEVKLVVKSDFMLAKGLLDVYETPYFHFQEYKPYKNPSGDSMAQLLEAFLIAQEMNQNGKPMYGVDIIDKNWQFVIMEGREYCIAEPFNAVSQGSLLKIIAILRKFRWILETRLMN